uniref:Gfo/Idh/MocA-like oxidoreductase N-terminal domain-containing protein n=1 Tax=Moniliophthora roreri TaxID=221103 RepID=A0A0W0F8H2_MONRR
MAPIKLGFVGLSSKGWATTVLAPPLLQPPLSSQYSLTAVSTTNEASAVDSANKWSEASGGKNKVKPFHGDGSKIAQDADVDLVVVSVKGPQHREPALAAIEAGKDVFVEWPAGKNLRETEELYEAAKRKGVRTIVGCQGRQSPAIRKVCRAAN